MNQTVVAKVDLSDREGVEMLVKDRGPWFPWGPYYPIDNGCYNNYWDDAGWPPLAVLMDGLRRAPQVNGMEIQGAQIDFTRGSIEALGFPFDEDWSSYIYWRFGEE